MEAVILFPAIDLKNGEAVRLEQGDMARATVFHRDPAEQARTFAAQGFEPDVGNGFPWDPTLIVIDALRKLGTNADARAVRDYILDVHGYAGTNGIYDYRDGSQRGQGLNALVIVRWDPAKKNVYTVTEPGGKPLARKP